MANKTYTAEVRQTVEMTKEQYEKHLRHRQDVYTRMIKDQDERLARAKKLWSKRVDEYEAQIKKIEAEIKAL